MSNPSEIIGPAAVKALQDAGYTLVPPKEPARIVTMEETAERCQRHGGSWGMMQRPTQGLYNAADDWLVKTVNRRIIEGLGSLYAGGAEIGHVSGGPTNVSKAALLSLFCGEEK